MWYALSRDVRGRGYSGPSLTHYRPSKLFSVSSCHSVITSESLNRLFPLNNAFSRTTDDEIAFRGVVNLGTSVFRFSFRSRMVRIALRKTVAAHVVYGLTVFIRSYFGYDFQVS